jgi:D-alanyl-lipoteichoic acid acyltransferase DltB (MBOAT superfamily)
LDVASFYFPLFVLLALAAHYLLPRKIQWVWRLLASLAFFAVSSSIPLLLAMVGMSALAYLSGLALSRISADEEPKRRKAISAAAVAIEAGILIALKENAFFVNNINTVFGTGLSLPSWVAPLGVSYYTLMLIGYVMDVNWQVCPAEKNFFKFLLFSCYFPQMTSGPITRFGEIGEELFSKRSFSIRVFSMGLTRIAWGFFKKLIVADGLAIAVNAVFSDFSAHKELLAVGACAYTLQLYADFSGLMDIMIGVSKLFGVKLPENFRQPFFSTSLSELWQRWHMTLGRWLKEFILYPFLKSRHASRLRSAIEKRLGKKAARSAPTYLGLLILWFAIGFWHGGTWKYIFGAGLFFYAMIALGMLFEPVSKRIIKALRIGKAFPYVLFQRIRTFLLFSFSISFCRMSSFTSGLSYWKTAFSNLSSQRLHSSFLNDLMDPRKQAVILFGLAAMLSVSIFQRRKGACGFYEKNAAFRWAAFICLAFASIIFGFYGIGYDKQSFIYGLF